MSSGDVVDTILDALGGRHAVMRALSVSRTAPYNWRSEGIPYHHWPDLVDIAQTKGVKWITVDVLRATRPRGGRSTKRERVVIDSKPVRKTSASALLGSA
jgi:hypothetical protein